MGSEIQVDIGKHPERWRSRDRKPANTNGQANHSERGLRGDEAPAHSTHSVVLKWEMGERSQVFREGDRSFSNIQRLTHIPRVLLPKSAIRQARMSFTDAPGVEALECI